MRKLKLQVQMSTDGFVAGPNGEMDWMTWNWGDDIKQHVNGLTDPVDTILLGRKMAGGFIAHWAAAVEKPDEESFAFGKKMTDTHKVVFTNTLTKSEWPNTDIATGDITDEVNKLKNQAGNDIIVYGGAGFVSSLIKAELIDEYNLFVNPSIIGNGMAIFDKIGNKQKLKLVKATPFDCGIVALQYVPQKG